MKIHEFIIFIEKYIKMFRKKISYIDNYSLLKVPIKKSVSLKPKISLLLSRNAVKIVKMKMFRFIQLLFIHQFGNTIF